MEKAEGPCSNILCGFGDNHRETHTRKGLSIFAFIKIIFSCAGSSLLHVGFLQVW